MVTDNPEIAKLQVDSWNSAVAWYTNLQGSEL